MFEIQLEKSKSAKLNTRKNFKPHGIAMSLDKGIENVFVFQAISMHLHPDFEKSCTAALHKFFLQEGWQNNTDTFDPTTLTQLLTIK